MKNKIKKIAGAAVIILLLSLITSVIAVNAESTPVDDKIKFNQEQSIQAYQKIISHISEKSDMKNLADDENIFYSDNGLYSVYAGAYINSDGNLTVNLTNDSQKIKNEFTNISENEQIEFKKVQNSLEELTLCYQKLSEKQENAPYYKVMLSETDNVVKVYTDSEDECRDFVETEIGNSKLVSYNVGENRISDCSSVEYGQGFTCPESNYVGTIGFTCTREFSGGTKEKGFVTAAHVIRRSDGNTLGNTVTISGKKFGTVVASRYGNTVDAAFVKKDSSILPPWWTLKGRLTNGEKISSWGNSEYTPEGSTVKKFGGSTGETSGKIVSNMVSITFNGYSFHSLTETTARALDGDSGGPFIVASGGKNILVGITKAMDKETGNSYYCKIKYVMEELHAVPIVDE